MTTHVTISNSSDSNPSQHVRVAFERGNTGEVILLSPGECWSKWISDGDDISVKEIFSPKPKAEQTAG